MMSCIIWRSTQSLTCFCIMSLHPRVMTVLVYKIMLKQLCGNVLQDQYSTVPAYCSGPRQIPSHHKPTAHDRDVLFVTLPRQHLAQLSILTKSWKITKCCSTSVVSPCKCTIDTLASRKENVMLSRQCIYMVGVYTGISEVGQWLDAGPRFALLNWLQVPGLEFCTHIHLAIH